MPSILSQSSRTPSDQNTLTQKRKKRAKSLFISIFEDVRKFMQLKLEKQIVENPVRFFDEIRDGVLLCELTNKLSPGSVPTIVKPNNLRYRAIDNILQFLQYCEKQRGFRKESLFEPIDLYEKKNIVKVLLCLACLAGNGNVQSGIEPKRLFDAIDTESVLMELSEEDLKSVQTIEEPKVEEIQTEIQADIQTEKSIWTPPSTPVVKISIKDEITEVTFPQMSIVVFLFAVLFYFWSKLWYQTQENV